MMKKKQKWLAGTVLTMGLMMGLSVSAVASDPTTRSAKDSTFPRVFIGYDYGDGYNTSIRSKEDDSYNYVMNTSGFNLWVVTKAGTDNSNVTRGSYAIIPNGEWFITNYVYERGYRSCYLDITTAKSGVFGYLSGKWSPDSVGNYPVAN